MSRTVRFLANGHFFDHAPEYVIAKNWHHFQGWKCSAGVNGLFIDWQGDVYPGTCLVDKKNSLGSIESGFELPKQWLTCKKEVCHCNIEITLPKFKASLSNQEKASQIDFDENLKSNQEIAAPDTILPAYHFDRETKYVMWALGRRCNYSCSYCDDNSNSKTDPFLKREHLFNTVEKLQSDFAVDKKIRYTFTGGEPTLHPDFMDMVKKIHGYGHHIGITSNGSRLASYYEELIQYANLQFSLHFEFLNEEKIIKVVKALCDVKRNNPQLLRDRWLEVRFMIKPGGFDRAMALLNAFKKDPDFDLFYHYSFVPVRNANSLYLMKYDEEELQKIQAVMSSK